MHCICIFNGETDILGQSKTSYNSQSLKSDVLTPLRKRPL